MNNAFLALLDQRVLILDGAMGTSLQRYHPTVADWGGEHLVNLSDALAYTRSEWVRDVHRGFLAAGCDGVETNTFNGSKLVLAEFGLGDKVDELNRLNVRLAREAVREFTTLDRPRFVVGSVGPGTRMPSVLNESIYADFDTLADSYRPQLAA